MQGIRQSTTAVDAHRLPWWSCADQQAGPPGSMAATTALRLAQGCAGDGCV
jgi:hypothetical protein